MIGTPERRPDMKARKTRLTRGRRVRRGSRAYVDVDLRGVEVATCSSA
jgi:hypothetical protein